MMYLDFLRMGGAWETRSQEVVLSTHLSTGLCLGAKDSWFQALCRLMFGNGSTWSLQILLPVQESCTS